MPSFWRGFTGLLAPKRLLPDRSRPSTGEGLAGKAPNEEYYAVFLEGAFLSIRRGQIRPDGRGEIPGFWLFGAEGKSARNWEGSLKDQGPQVAWGSK